MKKIYVLLIIMLIFGIVPVSDAASDKPLELHVEGRYIYNSKGEKVRLTGGNIPDLSWATGGDNDLDKRVDMLCDQWNSNVVRLAVHSKFWYGEEWYQMNSYSGYRKKVDDIIKRITGKGKYVILNLHEFYAITEKNKRFWEEAAEVYKNNPGVLFGLLNEPHDISWDVWRNGGYVETNNVYGQKEKMKVYGHQQILEIIRKKGARNIVLAGGLDWAYYFDGITDGYDGLPHGYRLEEPAGYGGNGIIYDTHIYPMKPEYNPLEKAVDCIVNDFPVLVGEYGHWGERLFDWYENFKCEYPYIWMNEIHDYIDRNEINFTAWSFHPGASPSMFTNYDTFEPTLHSGYSQKHRLLSYTDTRPPENERTEDLSPISTWEEKIDFDTENAEFSVYGNELQTSVVNNGYKGKGLFVNFDIKETGKSAAIYEFSKNKDFSGAKWVSVRIKNDGDMRNVGFGLELSDGRQFICPHPMDLFENWKLLFLPLDTFKGEDGIMDTTKIKSFFVTSLDEGAGSFTIDDVVIAGTDYVKTPEFTVSSQTEKENMIWNAWEDSESLAFDSFAVTEAPGKINDNTVLLKYIRPSGSYGGQARASIPTSWNIKEADYFAFWAKGDGTTQKFTVRFDCDKGTTLKEQRSNFKKREFERFACDITITGSEWKYYKIPFTKLGLSDVLHKDRIRFVNFFNRIENKKGSLMIDNFSFTNIGEPLNGVYIKHEPPKKSEPVGEIKTKLEKNKIIQLERTFEVVAGQDAYLHIHLMNKTDKNAKGQLKIEGLPVGEVENAKYDTYAGYISYPHYPWREYSYSNFKVNIPEKMVGEYTVRVTDVSDNGVEPKEYKLIVKSDNY